MPTPTWTMRLANHSADLDAAGHDTKGMFKVVRVATTANMTIATALNSGDTIDGVTLASGDRVLVKDQSTGSQNGIYVAGATPTRAEDFDVSAEIVGSVTYVVAGTANAGKAFKNTNTAAVTVDTTALTFAEFGVGGLADQGSFTYLDATEAAAPGTPASGKVRLYAKTDGLLYSKDDAGTETVVTGGTGGGGGLTHAYAGYNTIGGSTENIVNRRQYMKKITLANDCEIVSISAYIKQITANQVLGTTVGVLSDNAGSPELVLATGANDTTSNSGFYATNTGSAGAARWLSLPVGLWVVAGDYWLAVEFELAAASHDIYFDGSGGDRYYTNNALRISDSGWTAVTTSSNKYSIRASTIR